MPQQTQMGEDGKDTVIFASKKDHAAKSTIELPMLDPAPGVILPNGDINWLCPCLGGLATGPCGVPFRKAFTCFHMSSADPKGSDCVDAFKVMQDCMVQHPKVYKRDDFTLPETEETPESVKCSSVKDIKLPRVN